MDETEHSPEENERLMAALRRLDPRVFIPPAVDDRVIAAARRHFGPVRRSGRRWSRSFAAFAAAACVVLAAGLWALDSFRRESPAGSRGDVDRSGTVDILDALALARLIENGSVAGQYDFNGDGVVDRRDVDLVAAQAVALEGRGNL